MWPFSKPKPVTDIWAVFDGKTQVGTPPVGYVRAPKRREAARVAQATWTGISPHLSQMTQDDMREVRAQFPDLTEAAFHAEVDRRVVSARAVQ